MTDEEREVRKGRHTITTSVGLGTRGQLEPEIDDEHFHHISGDVEIEVSGADVDRPHTYALVEALEDAVIDTVDGFDGGDPGA